MNVMPSLVSNWKVSKDDDSDDGEGDDDGEEEEEEEKKWVNENNISKSGQVCWVVS